MGIAGRLHQSKKVIGLQQMEEIIGDILDGELRHRKRGSGRQDMRFISAISCRGKVRLDDSVNKLCKQNYKRKRFIESSSSKISWCFKTNVI